MVCGLIFAHRIARLPSEANEVFCTSMHSYTAEIQEGSADAGRAPVDLTLFAANAHVRREPSSFYSLRASPPRSAQIAHRSDRRDTFPMGASFVAYVYGSPLPETRGGYYAKMKCAPPRARPACRHRFYPGVPNEHAPHLHISGAHDIFVKCSRSGMYDKTLYEASRKPAASYWTQADDLRHRAGEQRTILRRAISSRAPRGA